MLEWKPFHLIRWFWKSLWMPLIFCFGSSSINECDQCLKYLLLYSSSMFIAGWSRAQPLDIGRDLQNLASIRPFSNTGTDAWRGPENWPVGHLAACPSQRQGWTCPSCKRTWGSGHMRAEVGPPRSRKLICWGIFSSVLAGGWASSGEDNPDKGKKASCLSIWPLERCDFYWLPSLKLPTRIILSWFWTTEGTDS